MQQYVAGLLFSEDSSQVALVLKNRPAWQAGKLNAIGGKIEEGEGPTDAMVREFAEETGVEFSDWQFQFTLTRPEEYEVYFFAGWNDYAINRVETREDEPIVTIDPFKLPDNVIFNIRWIIPLVLDGNTAIPDQFIDVSGY